MFISILSIIILFSTAFICQAIDQALFKYTPEEEEIMYEKQVMEGFEWQDIEIEYMEKKEREMKELKKNLLKDKKDYFEKIDKWWEEEYNKGQATTESSSEEEQIIQDTKLTYRGDFGGGIPLDIAINFSTAEVTGRISLDSYDKIDCSIEGKINLETLFVNGTFSGTWNEEAFNGLITGTVSEDLNTFNGCLETNIAGNWDFNTYRYNY